MSGAVKFVLVGPNAGKSIGFSKDHAGNPRYVFRNGVMAMHPTRVTGRFVKFMKSTYSAVLESELEKANGLNQHASDGDNAVGSEDVQGGADTTEAKPHPAAAAAIELTGDADAEPKSEKQPAKGRKR